METNIVLIASIITCILRVAIVISYLLTEQPKKKIIYVLGLVVSLTCIIGGGSEFFILIYPSVIPKYQSTMMEWLIFGMGAAMTYGTSAMLGVAVADNRRCK